MPFGRKSPFEALALPGVILAYKYSQFRQRRREAASRRVTERELSALHHKIDKLLSKLEESEPDPPSSQEDECVICINARATMQTSPCGHRVVCRRCFVKTIQSAVAQRLLPLRCVICRARVNRLTSSSGTWRIQESASSYSMGGKSWASVGVTADGVTASASSYSMNDAHSGRHAFALHPHRYPRSPNCRVSQSDSLYSVSSTGSSSAASVFSKTSSISSDLCSPASPISPTGTKFNYNQSTMVINGNHLAPPTPSTSPHSPSTCGSGISQGSLSPKETGGHHSHSHHSGCPAGCSGAIPRKPLKYLSNSSSSGSCSSSSGLGGSNNSVSSNAPTTPAVIHTYPGQRHTKGKLVDILPPIKEFRSPAKVPHPSPVHISNPRFRYASYTSTLSTLAPPPKHHLNVTSKQTTAITKEKRLASTDSTNRLNNDSSKPNHHHHNHHQTKSAIALTTKSNNATIKCTSLQNTHKLSSSISSNSMAHSPSSNFTKFTTSKSFHKEKSDNKKNENVERRKEEKLKLKAEKEAKKEEKRMAKEEERLAKLIAKEEKKKCKKEVKELLLANDGNSKK